MIPRLVIALFCCFSASLSYAQVTSDTLEVATTATDIEAPLHSTKKATLLSTAVPGLGQVYNKQIWKVPIVYAGLGISIYFINDNTKNFRHFRGQLLAEIDGDPTTINETAFASTQLREITEQYRRWRDWSYISLVALYGLNIIDANVSAHLFYFDVSDDLSFRWSPSLLPGNKAGIALQLQF